MLDITVSARCCAHQFAKDPAPLLAELEVLARDHRTAVAASVGRWVGFYADSDNQTVTEALRAAYPDAVIPERRVTPAHGTEGFQSRA